MGRTGSCLRHTIVAVDTGRSGSSSSGGGVDGGHIFGVIGSAGLGVTTHFVDGRTFILLHLT